MDKTPKFDTTYDPVVSHQKVWKKHQNLTQHMTLYSMFPIKGTVFFTRVG